MRRLFIGLIGLFILSIPSLALGQGAGTPLPGGTPSASLGLGQYLLTEDQVPEGLVMIQDGERTLQDVSAGFEDPEAAMAQFLEWGWNGNVVRAFHTLQGADSDPEKIDGIYISVHAFGSPEAARDALDYTSDAHASGGNLEDIRGIELGDASRILYGEMSYGDEVTVYVQQGSVLFRLSAASPEGNPTGDAIRLTRLALEVEEAAPVATPHASN